MLGRFVKKEGYEAIKRLTNISISEFLGKWLVIEEHVSEKYNVRGGRKCPHSAKAIFLYGSTCVEGRR